ncbi:MAG TPA: pilus assembly protein TadG-related protein [Acidimicrobiales bacterium]|nr:pilus assembly protein TadG-related protein [Acidimicrobiales bacterium]
MVIVLWTVALTALLGFVALAVDMGNDVQTATNVQNAADAAAIAGASLLPASEAQAASVAQEVVAKYGFPDWTGCTGWPTGWDLALGNCIAFSPDHRTVWVEIPAQTVPSLFGNGGGLRVERQAYASVNSGQAALCYTAPTEVTVTTMPGEC